MIHFEQEDSPLYDANKLFVEKTINDLQKYNAQANGFCNSFGYDINISFTKNNVPVVLKLNKSQSTQNGVVVPINAIDTKRTELIFSNIGAKSHFAVGKSVAKRLFTSHRLKEIFPSPYYVDMHNEDLAHELSKFVSDNQIEEAHLTDGNFTVVKYDEVNCNSLIDQCEQLIEQYK